MSRSQVTGRKYFPHKPEHPNAPPIEETLVIDTYLGYLVDCSHFDMAVLRAHGGARLYFRGGSVLTRTESHAPGQPLAATPFAATADARNAAAAHGAVEAVVTESLAKCLPEVPVEVGVDDGVES